MKRFLACIQPATPAGEIQHPALLERLALNAPPLIASVNSLDSRKHPYLQQRIGRDNRIDLFIGDVRAGVADFWQRFQLPFATNPETVHLDENVIKGVVDDLMGFNGWMGSECASLNRPYTNEADAYHDLSDKSQTYYFALVLHSAEHFVIDHLSSVIQVSRRLGPENMFVSVVDYGSNDSTAFLCDLTEMVLVLLNIPFKIRRVELMHATADASYYPLEEAYTRNLALEPLQELWKRRRMHFQRVIWLKGFTCPNDILESLRVSYVNDAAMVCGMDWKEHNGFFLFNDRWRSRDMLGQIFRGSRSTSNATDAPPRDALGMARFAQHLPFQTFCCDSGMHIVDPAQSYYAGLSYRSSVAYGVFNISESTEKIPKWSEGPCMDSTQLHFCRDIWMASARKGVDVVAREAKERQKRGLSRNLTVEWEALLEAAASVPSHAHFRPQQSLDELLYMPLAKDKGAAFRVDALLSEQGEHSEDVYVDTHDDLSIEELEADRRRVAAADLAAAELPAELPVDREFALTEAEEDASLRQKPKVAKEAIKKQAGAAEDELEEVLRWPANEEDEAPVRQRQRRSVLDADESSDPAIKAEDNVNEDRRGIRKRDLNAQDGTDSTAWDDPLDVEVVELGDNEGAPEEAEVIDDDALFSDEAVIAVEDSSDSEQLDNADTGIKPEGKAANKAKRKKADKADDKSLKEKDGNFADKKAKPEIDQPEPDSKKDELASDKRNPIDRRDDAAADGKDTRTAEDATAHYRPHSSNEAEVFEEVSETTRDEDNLASARAKSKSAIHLPNSAFVPARILVHPRCVTTYAGVSHLQLTKDLFGNGDDESDPVTKQGGRYALQDSEWQPAPETFVCQEVGESS